MTIGDVIADENAWQVASGCAKEAFNVAKARGIKIDFDNPVEYVLNFGSKILDARPSMLLDLMEGRPSEIDVINGADIAGGCRIVYFQATEIKNDIIRSGGVACDFVSSSCSQCQNRSLR